MTESGKCPIYSQELCAACVFPNSCVGVNRQLEIPFNSWVKELGDDDERKQQIFQDIACRIFDRGMIRRKLKKVLTEKDLGAIVSHASDDIWLEQFRKSHRNGEKGKLKMLFEAMDRKFYPTVLSVVTDPHHRQLDECSPQVIRGNVAISLFENNFKSILSYEARRNATFFTYLKQIIYFKLMDCLDGAELDYTPDPEDVPGEGSPPGDDPKEVWQRIVAQVYQQALQEIARQDFGGAIILLFKFQNMTNGDVAEELGIVGAKNPGNNITQVMGRHKIEERFSLIFSGILRRQYQVDVSDINLQEVRGGGFWHDSLLQITTVLQQELVDKVAFAIEQSYQETVKAAEKAGRGMDAAEEISQFIANINDWHSLGEQLMDADMRADATENANLFCTHLGVFLKKNSKIKAVYGSALKVPFPFVLRKVSLAA